MGVAQADRTLACWLAKVEKRARRRTFVVEHSACPAE